MSLLLNKTRDLNVVARDVEKAEVLNLPLLQSLLARPAFRNPRSLESSGAKKMYPWWKRIRSGNTRPEATDTNWNTKCSL